MPRAMRTSWLSAASAAAVDALIRCSKPVRSRYRPKFFEHDTAQVHALRERHHVYMTDDSRMNIAGLRRENLVYFARAVAQVLAE